MNNEQWTIQSHGIRKKNRREREMDRVFYVYFHLNFNGHLNASIYCFPLFFHEFSKRSKRHLFARNLHLPKKRNADLIRLVHQ